MKKQYWIRNLGCLRKQMLFLEKKVRILNNHIKVNLKDYSAKKKLKLFLIKSVRINSYIKGVNIKLTK